MSSLKGICVELDDRILTYFEALDRVHATQHELDCLLRDGFLLLAKARYTMGVGAVSPLQFTEDTMEASMRVDMEPSDQGLAHFSVATDSPATTETEGNSELRQRNVGDQPQGVEDVTVEEEKSNKKADPLKWFGVLVPQALRQSQAMFRRAAEVSCDLATMKLEAEHLRQKCKAQLQHKEDIINGVAQLEIS